VLEDGARRITEDGIDSLPRAKSQVATLKAPRLFFSFMVDIGQELCFAANMFEAAITEFPFVEAMPKREKSKLAKVWDTFEEIRRITEERGVLVPAGFVAKLLNVSNQRIGQLMETESLERVDIGQMPFITERSIIALAQTERKAGRPFKTAKTGKEIWQAAYATARGK